MLMLFYLSPIKSHYIINFWKKQI